MRIIVDYSFVYRLVEYKWFYVCVNMKNMKKKNRFVNYEFEFRWVYVYYKIFSF